MRSKIFSLFCLIFAIILLLPITSESKGGGGRGGHYYGGSSSSRKGSHYSNPKTGNHYTKGGSRSYNRSYYKPRTGNRYTKRNSQSYSGSKIRSIKHGKINSHSSTNKISYHGSVIRDSHGRIERSQTAKQQFLHSKGYKNVPKGYEVDHIVPLYAGGSDTPSNMQLITKAQHQAKTKVDYQRYGQ